MNAPSPVLAFLVFVTSSVLAGESATFLELPYTYIIGGRADGKWLNSEQAGKTITAGTAYRLYSLKGEAGKVTAAKASPDEDICPDLWLAEVERPNDDHTIGIAAPWNPQPRVAKAAATTQEVYLKAVADLLAAEGIHQPKVVITQHLRVDLDGDGEEEVLLSATHYAGAQDEVPTGARMGDYSFVALRRVLDGKVVTQILQGEFYSKSEEFSAPNVHKVCGLLDLDGDGGLEILLHWSYYEGGGTTVWQMGKTRAEKVLEIACGV